MSAIQAIHLFAAGILLAVLFAVATEVWLRSRKRYCPDCGKRLLERHARVGYDMRTGRVRILEFRSCPDAEAERFPEEFDDDIVRCHARMEP